MFQRFTNRAKRVLVLAQEEARLLNHSFIGTEHILLGLFHEGEGLAAKALESLGISLEDVRVQVTNTVPPASSGASGSAPFTPRAKKVLELALREALQLGHNDIGTEHLLLGLIREGEGVGARVLESLGATLPTVRRQIVQSLSAHHEQLIRRSELFEHFDPDLGGSALDLAVLIADADPEALDALALSQPEIDTRLRSQAYLSALLLDMLAASRHEPFEKTVTFIRQLLEQIEKPNPDEL